ncbi:thioredoxin domain-containing protein [Aquirufa sp. HETE-40SA]
MKNRIPFLSFLFVSLLNLNTFAQNVDADTFEKKIKETPNAYLLDVRTSGEFGGGHLPNAVNIDVRSPEFNAKVAQLSKDRPVLIYCLSGGRSAQAAEQMRAAGFQVTEMKGGYLKWTTRLKPLEGVPNVKHDAAWNLGDFKKEIASSDAVVVDFYAKWCAPCLKMMPIVDKLSAEFKGRVTVLKVEADGNQAIMQAYGIDEIPSFMVFSKGELITKTSGFREEAALKELFTATKK